MPKFLKSLVTVSITSILVMACTNSPQKNEKKPIKSNTRIFIPQEKVIITRQVPTKPIPASYLTWLNSGDNQVRVQEYETFLKKNNVLNIVPSFELLKTARDWQKCGRSQYAVPNKELWNNAIPTLQIFKVLIATNVLTDFEVTSVYRDLPLNQCAGGATSSRHLFNSAIDFRIGPEFPQPKDYATIENSKFKLCQFWRHHGPSLNMGLGLYASGQIHIDTQGYRTWGPDHTRNSSMCNY